MNVLVADEVGCGRREGRVGVDEACQRIEMSHTSSVLWGKSTVTLNYSCESQNSSEVLFTAMPWKLTFAAAPVLSELDGWR